MLDLSAQQLLLLHRSVLNNHFPFHTDIDSLKPTSSNINALRILIGKLRVGGTPRNATLTPLNSRFNSPLHDNALKINAPSIIRVPQEDRTMRTEARKRGNEGEKGTNRAVTERETESASCFFAVIHFSSLWKLRCTQLGAAQFPLGCFYPCSALFFLPRVLRQSITPGPSDRLSSVLSPVHIYSHLLCLLVSFFSCGLFRCARAQKLFTKWWKAVYPASTVISQPSMQNGRTRYHLCPRETTGVRTDASSKYHC